MTPDGPPRPYTRCQGCGVKFGGPRQSPHCSPCGDGQETFWPTPYAPPEFVPIPQEKKTHA
jgi:hypothetical protein